MALFFAIGIPGGQTLIFCNYGPNKNPQELPAKMHDIDGRNVCKKINSWAGY
jgi:hypothetical protein